MTAPQWTDGDRVAVRLADGTRVEGVVEVSERAIRYAQPDTFGAPPVVTEVVSLTIVLDEQPDPGTTPAPPIGREGR